MGPFLLQTVSLVMVTEKPPGPGSHCPGGRGGAARSKTLGEVDRSLWETSKNEGTSPFFMGKYQLLVGSLEHFLFSHILGRIIPTD